MAERKKVKATADAVEKVRIKSILPSTLIHNGIKIKAGKAAMVEKTEAEKLIKKGYCELDEI